MSLTGATPAEQDFAAITPILKALSEPNRLRIFATLMFGDSCNGELQGTLGLAPSLLSHHLCVLEKQATSPASRLPEG